MWAACQQMLRVEDVDLVEGSVVGIGKGLGRLADYIVLDVVVVVGVEQEVALLLLLLPPEDHVEGLRRLADRTGPSQVEVVEN